MGDPLSRKLERDRGVWDACAEEYERVIVEGHPDVTAYEAFEEDLLDRLLLHLIRDRKRQVHLLDVGCGSGRLHLRYGLKICPEKELPREERRLVDGLRSLHPGYGYDPVLAGGLAAVGGIDFSASMIGLAGRKLASAGLTRLAHGPLYLKVGSAFDLMAMPGEPLPLVVSVCNSVGVTQGPSGAVELLKSMRRAVESAGGIAIVSAYRAEAVESFALGNYESTMNVSGQPRWLTPDTYAAARYVKIPRAFKRGHASDPTIVVDVLDEEGNLVERGFQLERDPAAVREVIEDGHIRTHTDYESYWYGFDQFAQWISDHWPEGKSHLLEGRSLDALRAEPVQLAVLDPEGWLDPLLERWAG
jgi:SAM-dependent methyltransferase